MLNKDLPPEAAPFEKSVPTEEIPEKKVVTEAPLKNDEPKRVKRKANPVALSRRIFWLVLAAGTALWASAFTLGLINDKTSPLGTSNGNLLIVLICALLPTLILLTCLFIKGGFVRSFSYGGRFPVAFAAFVLTLAMAFTTVVAALSAVKDSTDLFGKGAVVFAYDSCIYKVTGENEVSLADGTDFGGTTLVIPEKVNGYSVTSIGERALLNCVNMRAISVPDSVTEVAETAFSGCKYITMAVAPACAVDVMPKNCLFDVVVSSGEIKDEAFANCTSLTSVTLSDGVTAVGNRAFMRCTSLEKLSVADSIVKLGERAFYGCDKLSFNEYLNARYLGSVDNPYAILYKVTDTTPTTFVIHPKTKIIYGSAFYGCRNLTQIPLPEGLSSISAEAFYNSGLTEINIPASVKYIGEKAFGDCSALRSITVASRNENYRSVNDCLIDTAEKTLVAGCSNSVIPTDGSVKKIGAGAFYGCSNFTQITIPAGVTEIGNDSFNNCYNLNSIALPKGVEIIGDRAFNSCSDLTEIVIPDGVKYVGNYAFTSCLKLKSISLPDSVETIGNGVFFLCRNLTEFTVPKSTTKLGEGMFRECSLFYKLTVASGNKVFYSVDNCVIERETKVLVAGSNGSVIPGDGSVTEIGNGAFYECFHLEQAVIPDGVTKISDRAFDVCIGLTTVTIPHSVKAFGQLAFGSCRNLKDIYYDGTKSQWQQIDKYSDLYNKDWDNGTENFTVHCTDGYIEY